MASHALPRRAGTAPRLLPRKNLLAARATHRKGTRVKFFNRGRDRSASNTRRQGASRLGAALAADLEAFGRFSYDPQGSQPPGDLEARMYALYQTDVEAFLTALAAAASGHGGWVAYGAERMMVSIAGGDLQHPAYDLVMAQALTFLRVNGVPNSRLSSYERSWWLKQDAAVQSWLHAKLAPAAAAPGITPLRPEDGRGRPDDRGPGRQVPPANPDEPGVHLR
jgi:hypothetical protein